jgi:hypothetical protein
MILAEAAGANGGRILSGDESPRFLSRRFLGAPNSSSRSCAFEASTCGSITSSTVRCEKKVRGGALRERASARAVRRLVKRREE